MLFRRIFLVVLIFGHGCRTAHASASKGSDERTHRPVKQAEAALPLARPYANTWALYAFATGLCCLAPLAGVLSFPMFLKLRDLLCKGAEREPSELLILFTMFLLIAGGVLCLPLGLSKQARFAEKGVAAERANSWGYYLLITPLFLLEVICICFSSIFFSGSLQEKGISKVLWFLGSALAAEAGCLLCLWLSKQEYFIVEGKRRRSDLLEP